VTVMTGHGRRAQAATIAWILDLNMDVGPTT
jgi:hypothetical protein